jgi:[ribosomal protein S18]-alanine N-acetyltransferase
LRVRSATAADIPAIMELERHTGAAAHWSREQYERMFEPPPPNIPNYVVLVIEDEAGIQGFLLGQAHADEWELQNVAVTAAAHRRGFGGKLLTAFLEQARARGASAVYLEVRESNQAARAFYEKWLFKETGRRKDYYTSPLDDAILYSLSLS